MRGRLGMNTESPMHIMHLPSSRAFNSRGYRQTLWYAPSTMVLVLRSGQYRTPRYFDVAHTEDHRVPYALVVSCTEHHGIWTRATPWCSVEYRVCCGSRGQRRKGQSRLSRAWAEERPGRMRHGSRGRAHGWASVPPTASQSIAASSVDAAWGSGHHHETRMRGTKGLPPPRTTNCHAVACDPRRRRATCACHTRD